MPPEMLYLYPYLQRYSNKRNKKISSVNICFQKEQERAFVRRGKLFAVLLFTLIIPPIHCSRRPYLFLSFNMSHAVCLGRYSVLFPMSPTRGDEFRLLQQL